VKVIHAAPSVARAHEALVIRAGIEHPERAAKVVLVYRAANGAVREVAFLRSPEAPYVAVIPGEDVDAPGIAYAIEVIMLAGASGSPGSSGPGSPGSSGPGSPGSTSPGSAGARVSVFASRDAMHEVAVPEDIDDVRERALLARVHGRRSVVSTSAEYAQFGSTLANVQTTQVGANGKPGSGLASTSVPDRFWRADADYTYRMLGVVSEFGIRAGVVRGTSVVPNETDASKFDVGLNYGAPHLTVRLVDWLHVEGEFLTSITEIGFSLGGGLSLLLGDPYGTHLTLGFESIDVFGTRGFSRMDIAALERITVAPIVEVTDMPHAAKTGVRLLGEVRADIGQGFAVAVRTGYQARDAASGGPDLGTTLSYAF
jgi:hypothetical protein